jgi:hypothetical protein
VNRAGGRSGSLRNIGRIEQWNVGSGATAEGWKRVHLLPLCAVSGHTNTPAGANEFNPSRSESAHRKVPKADA